MQSQDRDQGLGRDDQGRDRQEQVREPDAELLARHLDADGRLTSMPAKRNRRLLVLAHLAAQIPADVELDEFAVNGLLRGFDHDVATLRRYLVDEGMLLRPTPGRYVRPSVP